MRNKQARTRAQDLLSPFPSDAARIVSGASPLLSSVLKAKQLERQLRRPRLKQVTFKKQVTFLFPGKGIQ